MRCRPIRAASHGQLLGDPRGELLQRGTVVALPAGHRRHTTAGVETAMPHHTTGRLRRSLDEPLVLVVFVRFRPRREDAMLTSSKPAPAHTATNDLHNLDTPFVISEAVHSIRHRPRTGTSKTHLTGRYLRATRTCRSRRRPRPAAPPRASNGRVAPPNARPERRPPRPRAARQNGVEVSVAGGCRPGTAARHRHGPRARGVVPRHNSRCYGVVGHRRREMPAGSAETMPRSVTIPEISRAGVTSKAQLRAAVPAGVRRRPASAISSPTL